MNKRALDRARARSLARVSRNRNTGTLGTDPAKRVLPIAPVLGPVRRSRAVPMTGAQKDSTGRTSDWARSMDYFTDPKWDQTLSSQHVGTGGFR